MKYCNSCGTKIGILSKKYDIENNTYCATCYQKLHEENEKNQKKIKRANDIAQHRKDKEKEHKAFEVYKTISKKVEELVHEAITIFTSSNADSDLFSIQFFGSIKLNSANEVSAILDKFENLNCGSNRRQPEIVKIANDFKKLVFDSIEFFNDRGSRETRNVVEDISLAGVNNLFGGFFLLHSHLKQKLHGYLSEEQLQSLKSGDFSYEDMLLFIFNEFSDECKRLTGKFISRKRNDQIEYDIHDFFDVNSEICASSDAQAADFLKKYLFNRTPDQRRSIESIYCDTEITRYFERYSLSKLREYYDSLMTYLQSKNQSRLSLNEIDESINNKHHYELVFEFLDDLGKIQKIFSKRNIKVNYTDIHQLFLRLIVDEMHQQADEIVSDMELYVRPIMTRLSMTFEQNYDKEKVKNELYRYYTILKYLNCFDDTQVRNIVTIILEKLNLSFTTVEIENILQTFKNDHDLQEFEESFGKSKRLYIGDYERLSGYEFEKYLSQLFKYLGYDVFETPSTGDQGADLILSKLGQKVVVQAKKYTDKVSNKAVQEVFAAKSYYKADKAIVVTTSSFTDSAIQLAISNEVELWDNEKIKHMVSKLKVEEQVDTLDNLTQSCSIIKEGKKIININCPLCDRSFDLHISSEQIDEKCPLCEFPIKGNMRVRV